MSIVQASNDIRVFVDEDHDLTDVSEDFLGRKAFSLYALKDMDVPVPPFFVLSGSIFTEYISECLKKENGDKLSDEDIRKKIENGAFPEETVEQITRAYSRLSGFAEALVSVRSSIVLPHTHRALSCAGVLQTVLNIKGSDDLITSIKNVYASAFTPQTADYLARHNISIADIKVAIVVQKMVQSEAAGVVFTVDPISQNDRYLTIEAVFGLGDVIAGGDITPDQYIIDKKSLEFVEKKIVPQDWMMVRKIRTAANGGGEQKVKISKAWQNQQKLENRYVQELAKIALVVERKSQTPQDIEWVFEGGRLWLLQSTDAIPLEIPDSIADIPVKMDSSIVTAAQVIAEREVAKRAVKEELRKKKAESKKKSNENEKAEQTVFTEKPFSRQVVTGREKKKEKPVSHISPLPGEKLLITGIGASGTTSRGTVVIVSSASDIEPNKRKFKEGTIVVMPEHLPEFDRYIPKVSGLIVDTGGTTSDVATMCRERGLPCIMGCFTASKMLKDGENALVDGTIGAIYGKREYQPPPAPPKKVLKQKREKVPKYPKAHEVVKKAPTIKPSAPPPPQEHTATKLYCNLSDSYLRGESWKEQIAMSDGVAVIQFEDLYKQIDRHPEAFVEEGKKEQLVQRLAGYLSEICDIVADRRVLLSFGSMTVSGYKSLPRGSDFENLKDDALNESSSGLIRLLKHSEELSIILKTIRRVRNVEGWRTISLAIEHAGTPTLLSDFKKHLSSEGLRRSSTFDLFLHVSTSSEVVIMEDFVKTGIDGVFVDTPRLASSMMAPGVEDEAVVRMLETVKKNTPDLKSILHVPTNGESLLKSAVKLGYTGVAVLPSTAAETRCRLAEHERSEIFKK